MTITDHLAGDLAKVRIDLGEAGDLLADYWNRPADIDALADAHLAVEALLRAVSTLSNVVERLAEPKP